MLPASVFVGEQSSYQVTSLHVLNRETMATFMLVWALPRPQKVGQENLAPMWRWRASLSAQGLAVTCAGASITFR